MTDKNFISKSSKLQYKLITPVLSSISIGGYVRSEQRGRGRYIFNISYPILETEDYYSVYNEFQNEFSNGLQATTSTISLGLTRFQGSWSTNTITIDSVSGRDVTLTGFENNEVDIARAGDWIQFSDDQAVFQIIKTVSADITGNAIITLNKAPITDFDSSTTITRGNNVEFTLFLSGVPEVDPITSGSGIAYNIGDISLQEVRTS